MEASRKFQESLPVFVPSMDARAASLANAADAAVPNDDVSWHVHASIHASAHGHVADDGDGLRKSTAGHDGPWPGATRTSPIPDDANL